MISLLTSAKTDVGAAIKAAESVVETVNIRLAGTPAGGLPVGAQLDRRQDGDDGAGGLAGSGRLLHLSPVRNWRDWRAGGDLGTELSLSLSAADIELAGGGVHTLLGREGIQLALGLR